MTPDNRKDDQRARLLRAMIDIAAKDGYAEASIAKAITQAGVSRSTFYEHFEDKQACFVAAQQELGGRLLEHVASAAGTGGAQRTATGATLGALIGFSEEDPAGARVLMNEALAAGKRAMDRRDELVAQISAALEHAWEDAATEHDQPLDVPAQALVGGAFRLISIRILHGIGGLHELLPDLMAWTDSYSRVSGAPQWRTIAPGTASSSSRKGARAATVDGPAVLPPGRHGLPAPYVARNQRERILQATAQTMLRKGYAATTIADIVGAAHVTRGVFYSHFRNQQEAYLELHQQYFHQLMATASRAFFSAPSWPERVWEGIGAAAEMFATEPAAAHLGFLESHTIGPEVVRRTNDTVMAFAIFLEEGYRYGPRAQRLPQLCSEAIVAALFETFYLQTRRGRTRQFAELVPDVAYLALAPFMGPEQAGEFVEGKLRVSGDSPR